MDCSSSVSGSTGRRESGGVMMSARPTEKGTIHDFQDIIGPLEMKKEGWRPQGERQPSPEYDSGTQNVGQKPTLNVKTLFPSK